jgi:hypothetical protein
MSSMKDISDIPTAGSSLIVVAAVGDVLHFRMFDRNGKMIVDTDETKLTKKVRRVHALRERLKSLWPPHELTPSVKAELIRAVTSIVGRTPDRDITVSIKSSQPDKKAACHEFLSSLELKVKLAAKLKEIRTDRETERAEETKGPQGGKTRSPHEPREKIRQQDKGALPKP